MNRRQYLTRAGTAGTSTGLLGGLAGCLDDLSGSSDANEAADDGDSRTGERALSRAVGKLNEAAQSLEEVGSLENPADVEFDATETEANIEEARGHLDTADAELGDDRQVDIETLRSYADAIEGLVTVTATVTDDTITDDIDTITAAIESSGDIETASETVSDRHEKIVGSRERVDEVDATIQGIDADRLTELGGPELADLEEGAAALGDIVVSFETLAAAYDATLDLEAGYGALERGRVDFENGKYKAAKTEFETAETTFSESQQRLENGKADAPEGLVQYFETAACQTRHLTSAAGSFAEAAAAAANGDLAAAKRHKNDGEAALDDVGSCSN